MIRNFGGDLSGGDLSFGHLSGFICRVSARRRLTMSVIRDPPASLLLFHASLSLSLSLFGGV